MAVCRVGEDTGGRTHERPWAGSSRTHLVDGVERPVALQACSRDGLKVLVTGIVVVTVCGVCEQPHRRTGERSRCCRISCRRAGAWRHSAHLTVRIVRPCAVHACSEFRQQTAVARVEVVAIGRVGEYPNTTALERIWKGRYVTGTLSNRTQDLRLSQECCPNVTCDTVYFPTFRRNVFQHQAVFLDYLMLNMWTVCFSLFDQKTLGCFETSGTVR
jgi:hypothetical protein